MKPPRLLFHYLRSNWHIYGLAILSITVANIVFSYYPRVLGHFTDALKEGDISSKIIADAALTLLLIGITFGTLGGLGQWMIMRLGRKFEYVARRKLF
jgi:ATP-binding cassette, subfamily B, multidrug efflux pump